EQALRSDLAGAAYVPVAQLPEVPSLIGDGHVADRLDAPGPRQVAEVVQRDTGTAGVPVDEGDRQPLLEDRVVGTRVAVDDALAAAGQGVAGGHVVQRAQHPPATCVGTHRPLARMVGGPARYEG